MRVWLYRAFPLGFGTWYPDYVFDETLLAEAGLANFGLRAFSTHWIRRFPESICGRSMKYFTLLRSPVEQMLSQARYNYAPHAASVSMRDFLSRWLDQSHTEPSYENPQTNFFALHPWCDMQGSKFECDPARYHVWLPEVRRAYMRERLGVAKDVLRSFLAVGVTEKIVDSLDVLRCRAAREGFRLRPSQELTFENVTQFQLDDDSWIGEHDAVGRRFLESLTVDGELYGFARRLLHEACQSEFAAQELH